MISVPPCPAPCCRRHPPRMGNTKYLSIKLAGCNERRRKRHRYRCWTAFSTNTVGKMILAGTSGGRASAVRVIPGLILVLLAAWAGR